MKRILITFLIIFPSWSIQANAQQGLHAGLVLQPSLITMRPAMLSNSGGDFDPDFNQTLRASIGGQLDYHFTPFLGVGVNLIYSPQGQKFYVTNDSGKYESHYYKFNYLKLPLFLSYNTGGTKARLVGTFGPQIQVLMSAKDHYANKDHMLTDNYAPLNLGFHFGLGMGFFLSRNVMLTVAPNFDFTFLNYNFTGEGGEKTYLGKNPVSTCFGIQFGIKYVKNEVTEEEVIKAY